jgi:threonine/homoserine/homoserine lactone efflux protein
VSRLRLGEWTGGIGAVALFVLLFAPWFDPLGVSGWSALGWLTIVVVLLTIAAGAWLALATAIRRPIAQQVAAGILAATIGTLGFVELAFRVLVFQPGPNHLVTLRYGAYLGLLAALAVALGGWWALKDERTQAPESAYAPPPPRPAPPERAS